MLGALLTGATHYLERYMHPFFLLTPLWLVGAGGDERRRLATGSPCSVPRCWSPLRLIVVPIRLRDAVACHGS